MSALSMRYAQAILDLAQEKGQIVPVGEALRGALEMFRGSGELQRMVDHPRFDVDSRRRVWKGLADAAGFPQEVAHLLCLLSDRKRLSILPELVAAYDRAADALTGTVHAKVTSASALSDAYLSELRNVLEHVTGRQVVVDADVDESLIGGVVTRVGDTLFDGSLRASLHQVEEALQSDHT